MKRLIKEMAEYQKENDYLLEPISDEDLSKWKAILPGPIASPYQGGTFLLHIYIPFNYPMDPPQIVFKTRICHPNIHFNTGEICLDVLKTAWTPAYTLKTACDAICMLLTVLFC